MKDKIEIFPFFTKFNKNSFRQPSTVEHTIHGTTFILSSPQLHQDILQLITLYTSTLYQWSVTDIIITTINRIIHSFMFAYSSLLSFTVSPHLTEDSRSISQLSCLTLLHIDIFHIHRQLYCHIHYHLCHHITCIATSTVFLAVTLIVTNSHRCREGGSAFRPDARHSNPAYSGQHHHPGLLYIPTCVLPLRVKRRERDRERVRGREGHIER